MYLFVNLYIKLCYSFLTVVLCHVCICVYIYSRHKYNTETAGRMGVGLCEYRAAIGVFAWIAVNAGLHWRGRSKQQKSSRLRAVGGEETCEKGRCSNSGHVKKGWGSLDRRKIREREYVRLRSKTLNQRELRSRSHLQLTFRTRSQSHNKRRNRNADTSVETFKRSCISCKTKLFDQERQRGRTQRKEKCKGTHRDRHCSPGGKGMINNTSYIGATELHFLTSVAVSGCVLLEQAIFTVVQMLLVRAGIETNPGPTSPTSSVCCNAYQHFKRVKNTIEKAHNNFQSKATQETLTKKVIEIEETGI